MLPPHAATACLPRYLPPLPRDLRSYILTAGGEDLTVCVWRLRAAASARTAGTGAAGTTGATAVVPGGELAHAAAPEIDSDGGEEDDEDDSDVECAVSRNLELKEKTRQRGPDHGDDDDDDDVFIAEDPSEGEQLG